MNDRFKDFERYAKQRGLEVGTEWEQLLSVVSRLEQSYVERCGEGWAEAAVRVQQVQRRVQQAASEYPILFARSFEKPLVFLRKPARVKLAYAGNRAAKTETGAQEVIAYATGITPLILDTDEPGLGMGIVPTYDIGDRVKRHPDRSRYQMPVPNRGWVISTDFVSSRDVAEPKIRKYLPQSMIASWNKQDRIITLTNGSTIGFKSCESGRESFQGASLHWAWFDEEPPEDVYREVQMRLIDTGGVTLLTMTALKGFTFVYDEIVEVSDDRKDADTFAISWSTYENPYLDRNEIRRLSQGLGPIELMVRVYGHFMGLDGLPVFDLLRLKNWYQAAPRPVRVEGGATYWRLPRPNHQYVFGCDVAEGIGGDWSVVEFIDRWTWEQTCEFRAQVDPRDLADVIFDLAMKHNEAWGYIEANNHGYTTIANLRDRYPRLCYMQQPTSAKGQTFNRYGWRTDAHTKPLLVGGLKAALQPKIEEDALRVYSRTALRELMTYVKKTGKHGADMYGASGRKKDDCVIGLGLGVQAHGVVGIVESPGAAVVAPAHRRGPRYAQIEFPAGEEGPGEHPIAGDLYEPGGPLGD